MQAKLGLLLPLLPLLRMAPLARTCKWKPNDATYWRASFSRACSRVEEWMRWLHVISRMEAPVSNMQAESPALATVSSQPVDRATVTVVPAREGGRGQGRAAAFERVARHLNGRPRARSLEAAAART